MINTSIQAATSFSWPQKNYQAISLRRNAAPLRARAEMNRESAQRAREEATWNIFRKIMLAICDTEGHFRREANRLDREAAALETEASGPLAIPEHIVSLLCKASITKTADENAYQISVRFHLKREFGLSLEEALQIHQYIEERKDFWQNQLTQNDEMLRIEKEFSGLPRTIHVINDHGTLRIVVLFKRKGVKPVGHGTFKTVTHAIDWITGSPWAYSVIKDFAIVQSCHELALERLASERIPEVDASIQARVMCPVPIGVISYIHGAQGSQKLGFFTRLMNGSLESLLQENTLTPQQKWQIAEDLIDTLYILNLKRIEHRDIKPENILYERLDNKIRVYLADYGVARLVKPLSEGSGGDYLAGNHLYNSPEKTRCFEFVNWRLGTLRDFRVMIDRNWEKHDVWSLAITLWRILVEPIGLGLFSVRSKILQKENELRRNDRSGSDRDAIVKRYYLNNDDFYAQTFGHEPAPIKEPVRGTMQHLLWQALHYNPDQRISISQLRAGFRSLQERAECQT